MANFKLIVTNTTGLTETYVGPSKLITKIYTRRLFESYNNSHEYNKVTKIDLFFEDKQTNIVVEAKGVIRITQAGKVVAFQLSSGVNMEAFIKIYNQQLLTIAEPKPSPESENYVLHIITKNGETLRDLISIKEYRRLASQPEVLKAALRDKYNPSIVSIGYSHDERYTRVDNILF